MRCNYISVQFMILIVKNEKEKENEKKKTFSWHAPLKGWLQNSFIYFYYSFCVCFFFFLFSLVLVEKTYNYFYTYSVLIFVPITWLNYKQRDKSVPLFVILLFLQDFVHMYTFIYVLTFTMHCYFFI